MFLRTPRTGVVTMRVLRRFWPHIACTIVALALWETPAVKPFRVFTVQVHEMCHAGAALVTGGEVAEIRTHWNESGHMVSRGGYFPVISSAGYVGSALLGALLIAASTWPKLQRVLLGGIGCATVAMVVWYTPLWGVDFVFGVASGAVLLVIAARFRKVSEAGATWLGVMLCLYSLHDFRTDLWLNTQATDAGILARHWGLPFLAYPIAAVWAGVSVAAMAWALRAVELRRDRPSTGSGRLRPQG